ncbi:MAG: hydrogenase formation protein HypD [Glaciecola sp.]|jgi:hydrogenase expression/formation protein HypD
MQYVDEFRDPKMAENLTQSIKSLADKIAKTRDKPLQIMEFCGGHTHTIFKFGIEQLLPDSIELVHGPGCPVCVLPRGRVDDCIKLASNPKVIMTTFGDAMRVPGAEQSLIDAKASGADIRMVYSPMDALSLAKQNPDREIIFFALGFETTMPSTALTVLMAEAQGVDNFSLFCNHITTVPTIKAILDAPDMQIDAYIAPGHVSMVVGEEPFQFVSNRYQRPLVITGFEPIDIMQSLYMLLQQLDQGEAKVENQYKRVVGKEGNLPGLQAMAKIYELRDFFEWRGLGSIENSGVQIKAEYAKYDAEQKFNIGRAHVADPSACQCGEVIKGAIKPWQCKLFGSQCNPSNPMGALMVSSEGACAAYYSYGDIDQLIALRNVNEVA